MLLRILALSLIVMTASCANTKTEPDAPKPPDEAGAIAALKAINQAQQDFIRKTRRYALLYDELVSAHLLNEKPSKEKLGYDISMRPSPDAEFYSITATPVGTGPARSFYTDKSGVIR